MNMKVKIGEQIYEVELGDLRARPILATVDGQTYEVWPEESVSGAPAVVRPSASSPARSSTPPTAASVTNGASAANAVTAPIPGVITAIAIQPNASVQAGQELCTLEAMKMKNLIRAPRAGQIKTVHVTVGQHVRQKQVLVEYADES